MAVIKCEGITRKGDGMIEMINLNGTGKNIPGKEHKKITFPSG